MTEIDSSTGLAVVAGASRGIGVWNTWDLMKSVVPSMRASGAGWIVNISSRQAGPRVGPPFAPHPPAGSVLYGGTEAMLDRISTGSAMELYGDNIAVSSLAPNRGVATEHAAAIQPTGVCARRQWPARGVATRRSRYGRLPGEYLTFNPPAPIPAEPLK